MFPLLNGWSLLHLLSLLGYLELVLSFLPFSLSDITYSIEHLRIMKMYWELHYHLKQSGKPFLTNPSLICSVLWLAAECFLERLILKIDCFHTQHIYCHIPFTFGLIDYCTLYIWGINLIWLKTDRYLYGVWSRCIIKMMTLKDAYILLL